MPRIPRKIGHEDRLSIVDHLDELRSRLIVCGVALVIAFAFCFWQNQALLNILNAPLPKSVTNEANHLSGLTSDSVKASHEFSKAASQFGALSALPSMNAQERAILDSIRADVQSAANALPRTLPKNVPITIGVGEPFTTTLTVCFYFALLFALPLLLYEVYAFVIPALSPHERRVALPVMFTAPLLFAVGVVFTYLIVLPAAIHFLQGYNSNYFNALVQAKPLYQFEVLTMGAIGLAFQLPLGLLGLQRAGIINGTTLTRHWRYGIIIVAIIGAAMPGADPVTTGLETLPLLLLFLASIVLLKIADRRDARRAMADLTTVDDGTSPS